MQEKQGNEERRVEEHGIVKTRIGNLQLGGQTQPMTSLPP